MAVNTLLLVHETEQACIERMIARAIRPVHAKEIASYLAQSTDLEVLHRDIETACRTFPIDYQPVTVEQAPARMAKMPPDRTLVWILTDGIDYFRGTSIRFLAELYGLPVFGSAPGAFALCQDKFKAGAVMASLGCPSPAAGLARNGNWVSPPPPAPDGWFVKPNTLGAKIGIERDAHCHDLADALEISRRIYRAYGDDTIVQSYCPGRNARSSYLSVDASTDLTGLGTSFVGTDSDFQTMQDSLTLYGATGQEAKSSGRYHEPQLTEPEPGIIDAIRKATARLVAGIGLREVYSLDWRIADDGNLTLLEFEVCPGLPCFDFRAYCGDRWGMGLADAMAKAAAARFAALSGNR